MKRLARHTLTVLLTAALLVAGVSSSGAAPVDAPVADLGTSAKPVAAVADVAGAVFLLNEGDATISKLSAAGALTRVFARLTPACRPQGLAIDPKGALFVACGGTDSVTRVSPSGAVIDYWAYDGRGSLPRGITADSAGNVFVSNWGTSTITKIAADGSVVPVFARLDPADRPLGLTTDAAGSVYVADTQTNRVTKISAIGAVREVFAQLPTGPGAPTGPVAVAVDPWGTLYTANGSSSGGGGGTGGGGSGVGSVSSFAPDGSLREASVPLPPGAHRPTGFAMDPYGDLFVGDELSHALTAIDASDGSAVSVAGFGGTAILRAVALSGTGVYAADYVSGVVRRIELAPTLAAAPSDATLRRGVPVALDVAATGFGTRLVIAAGVLPPGLTLDPARGRLGGTPTTAGTYPIDIVAANHWGATAPRHVVLTVVR